MTEYPLISVICICYNHAAFVVEAMDSVLSQQNYPNIQLIVCDDASTDTSKDVIRAYIKDKDIQFIDHTVNRGNCKTFNEALSFANGKYVIDLAADDKLWPNALINRVKHFESVSTRVALTYSNAIYVDSFDKYLFDFNSLTNTIIPLEGNVFQALFEKRFICPPSVIFKTEVLKQVGGYDENLSYEDFDIWMRLARDYEFAYCDTKSVVKRVVVDSSSARFYNHKDNKHLASTLAICKKAVGMAQPQELSSIGYFILYHFRLAYFTGHFDLSQKFWALSAELVKANLANRFFKFLLDKKINIYFLYRLYLKIRLKDSKLS